MKPIKLLFIFLSLIVINSDIAFAQKTINTKSLIDSINLSLRSTYIFPNKAEEIGKYLRQRQKDKSYDNIQDVRKLAEVITEDICKIHRDPHMHVVHDKWLVDHLRKGGTENAEQKAQADLHWKENNYWFRKVEHLPGNVGYLKFDAFTDNIEAARPIISSALTFLSNTSAIILDLRANGGGSPDMVNFLESFFFKERTRMNDIIDGRTKDTTFYHTEPASTKGVLLEQPVYILTSKKTFSAAEDFTYGMQNAKRATIVGEITGGGAHPTMPVSVGQNFAIMVPFARSYNYLTGTDWEGTGIIPEIKTDASDALSKAQELIYTKMLNATTDAGAKRRFTYILNSLKKPAGEPDAATLTQYVGNYSGGLRFYLQSNRLYCQNTERNGFITELKPLSNSLFVLDENAQAEFLKDDKGSFSKLILHFASGFDVEKFKDK
jgi:retinol-binding protein 3